MKWLCQLKDGFMLGVDKGYVNKVQTGYPYPDIRGGQIARLSEYFSIDEFDLKLFVDKAITLDYPMSETRFKNIFYPDRYKMEKNRGTVLDLSNELNKLKSRDTVSNNPLISFEGKVIDINNLSDLDSLKNLFSISETNYSLTDYDLNTMLNCRFKYKKRSKILYVSGLVDDIKKLQGLIDKCYQGIDYEYHIEHETDVCKSFEKEMYILNVDSKNSLLIFGFNISSKKLYEFITSIVDKEVICKSYEGHKVISSENYNIVLEFDSYLAYKLNAGNGNWEVCKNKL